MSHLGDMKLAELDLKLEEMEDMTKEEILEEIRSAKEKQKMNDIERNHSTDDLLDLMVEEFDRVEPQDCSDFTLKKSGLIKVLMDRGAFDE